MTTARALSFSACVVALLCAAAVPGRAEDHAGTGPGEVGQFPPRFGDPDRPPRGPGGESPRGVDRSGPPPLRLRGTPGDDVLIGTSGNDVIEAGAGDDRVVGGGGRDVIRGGPGDDELVGGPKPDRLDGGSGDDVLFGAGSSDDLRGGPGRDDLKGGSGGDRLGGGPGRDRLAGGGGRDRVRCDGRDIVIGLRADRASAQCIRNQ